MTQVQRGGGVTGPDQVQVSAAAVVEVETTAEGTIPLRLAGITAPHLPIIPFRF